MKTRITELSGIEPPIIQAGIVAELIEYVPTCAKLIARIMTYADALIRKRLRGLMAA